MGQLPSGGGQFLPGTVGLTTEGLTGVRTLPWEVRGGRRKPLSLGEREEWPWGRVTEGSRKIAR